MNEMIKIRNVFCLICSLAIISCNSNKIDLIEFGYKPSEEFDIKLNLFSIPKIPVNIDDKIFWLQLDFGTAGDATITTAIQNKIAFKIIDQQNIYNSDGSYRGVTTKILIPSMSIFGNQYLNQKAELSDWRIFSTFPFSGNIGLNYFLNRRFTIDYRNKKFYLANTELPDEIVRNENYNVVDCEAPPEHFPTGIFVRGKIQDKETLIYIDSGTNRTFINRRIFPDAKTVKNVRIGSTEYKLKHVRMVDEIKFQNYNEEIGLSLGSDFLRNSVITIDRVNANNRIVLDKKS